MAVAYWVPLKVQETARFSRATSTSLGLGAAVGAGMALATGEAKTAIGAARSAMRKLVEACMMVGGQETGRIEKKCLINLAQRERTNRKSEIVCSDCWLREAKVGGRSWYIYIQVRMSVNISIWA